MTDRTHIRSVELDNGDIFTYNEQDRRLTTQVGRTSEEVFDLSDADVAALVWMLLGRDA